MSNPDNITNPKQLMEALLQNISANWTEQKFIHARDDIYYGEFSLGAELFAATISRGKKSLTASAIARIIDLFHLLNLDDSKYLEELRDYTASLGIDQSIAHSPPPPP